MYREHEEMMRREFFEQTRLSRNAFRSDITEAELNRIYTRQADYDQRWYAGPHVDEWAFLQSAYDDWQQRPKQMARFVSDVEHNHQLYRDFGLTDVQRRSLFQARDLARLDHTRAPNEHPEPQHEIERGR